MMDSSLGQHGIVLNLTFPKIVGSLSLSKLNYTLWQYKCEIVHLKQTHRSTLKKKKNYISIMNTSISQDTYILPLKIQLWNSNNLKNLASFVNWHVNDTETSPHGSPEKSDFNAGQTHLSRVLSEHFPQKRAIW